MCDEIENLKSALLERDNEIAYLKSQLKEKVYNEHTQQNKSSVCNLLLTQDEIKRYSRQLILPEISYDGQISLKRAKVLIVGAGGLGCPVGMYLTAAGVGTVGIVDYDALDLSNLHRQISHTENYIGEDKCLSLKHSLANLNSSVRINCHSLLLNSKNIQDIINLYDIIVDASDNVPTRYLLNDAAVLFKKPLVSGSALKFEGQLTVYNYLDGPCYRCLFPNPPSQEAVTNCSDGGVVGAVTGVIGSLQALEVIKIIIGLGASYCKKMLVFDGVSGDIRIIKLRGKKDNCEVCGKNPSVTELIDYELLCSAKANDKDSSISLLSQLERVSCSAYKEILESGIPHVLVDVRPENEIKICSLPNAYNFPISKITNEASLTALEDIIQRTKEQKHYVICRRGNDSQKAVKILQKYFNKFQWYDVIGGLYAWHDEIDHDFPIY